MRRLLIIICFFLILFLLAIPPPHYKNVPDGMFLILPVVVVALMILSLTDYFKLKKMPKTRAILISCNRPVFYGQLNVFFLNEPVMGFGDAEVSLLHTYFLSSKNIGEEYAIYYNPKTEKAIVAERKFELEYLIYHFLWIIPPLIYIVCRVV